MSGPSPLPPAGLCGGCAWAERVASRRSTFLRCRRAETDPAYPRYPPLPVLACAGLEPGTPRAAGPLPPTT
jgi:hypothetical protein